MVISKEVVLLEVILEYEVIIGSTFVSMISNVGVVNNSRN